MNISKFSSIFILTLFCTSSILAQEKTADKSQLLQSAKLKGSVSEGKEEVYLDSLYHRIHERDSLIKNKKPIEQVEILNQTVADKDIIIEILTKTINEKNEIISNLEAETKTIRFFKTEDATIFNSNFENFSLSDIPLCLKEHYQLILDIRELDELLSDIGQKIAKIEAEEYIKNLPDSIKQVILKPAIKEYLDKADSLIGQIDEKDKSGLYPEQVNYYRPFLIDKFNGYLDKIYSDE